MADMSIYAGVDFTTKGGSTYNNATLAGEAHVLAFLGLFCLFPLGSVPSLSRAEATCNVPPNSCHSRGEDTHQERELHFL